jgi:hypothetical protein
LGDVPWPVASAMKDVTDYRHFAGPA